MKTKILVFILIFSKQIGCSQNTTDYKQKIETIYKEVKTYDYNPTYQLKVNANLCTYEVYINDMLVVSSFTTGRTAGEQSIDIPQYILKTGNQSIKYKVFPKAIKNGVLENTVDKDATLNIRVVHGEYYKIKLEDFKEVLALKLPKIVEGLPYIEFGGTFLAKVPYTLEGWSKGMDLKNEDQKALEKEVLARMEEIAGLYRNKDIEGLAKEHYNRTKETFQAFFFSSPEESKQWESDLKASLNSSITIELVDNKTLKIMGDGKVVTFLISDGPFKNEPILRNETDEEYIFFPQYFYRPSPGAKLEVIR
ncbi:MAG TPA: hypothetical protein VF677_15635 [Flavobacterium sp.]|jgi:hypothetical protein